MFRIPDFYLVVLLTAGLAYTLFEGGGGGFVGWNIWLVVLGVAGVAGRVAAARDDQTPILSPWLGRGVLLLLCYVAFQLIPLPLGLVKMLSPARAHMLGSLGAVAVEPPAAALSIAPEETSVFLFRILGCTLIFLMIREMTSRPVGQWPWMAAVPLIVLGGLEAALGFLQKEEGADMIGTYGSKDHYAGLLEMVLPLTVAYGCALFSRGMSRREPSTANIFKGSLLLCIATGMFAVIALSLSKMGFMACIAGLFVTGALAIGTGELIWKKTAVAGLLALCLTVFIWLPPPELAKAFGQLDNDPTAEGRLPIWKDTLRLIHDYPVLGCGMGAFDRAFQKYQTSSLDSAIPYAHNDYLQIAAELGGVGFLIAAFLMVRISGMAVRAASRSSDVDIRYLGVGCAGGIAAILVHSLADFNLYIPGNAAVLAWISGIAAGLPVASRSGGEQRKVAWGWVVNSRTLALAVSLVLIVYAPAWLLFLSAFRSDVRAEKMFCRLGICDTDFVVYAQTVLHQGQVAAVPVATLEEAIRRDPGSPNRWCDIGEAMVKAGDIGKAGACFSNALALGHDDPPVLMRAAAYFFGFQANERALELTSRVLGESSSYDDAIFESYKTNKIAVGEIVERGLPAARRPNEAYLRSLMEAGAVGDAMAAWSGISGRGYASAQLANEYVDFLVRNQRPESAARAWAAYSGARRAGYLKSTWLYNGDFEFDPSGSAFDWKIDPVAGVAVALDGSTAHSGSRSLRIQFEGEANVDFRQVAQIAFVPPGAYRFEAYIRTQGITTDQGVYFHIFDPMAGGRLDVRTEQLTGTHEWRRLEEGFCVPPQTKLLEVQVARQPSWKFDNKISGAAWIDSVRLVKEGGECGTRSVVETMATP